MGVRLAGGPDLWRDRPPRAGGGGPGRRPGGEGSRAGRRSLSKESGLGSEGLGRVSISRKLNMTLTSNV